MSACARERRFLARANATHDDCAPLTHESLLSQITAAFDWNQAFFMLVTEELDVAANRSTSYVPRALRVTAAAKRRWSVAARRLLAASSRPFFLVEGDDHCHVPANRLFDIDGLAAHVHNVATTDDDIATIECRDCEVRADMRE